MRDPVTVAKKVKTFCENFDSETRKRFSDAAKKRWADPKFREKMAILWKARGDKPKWEEGRAIGRIVSTCKDSLRKRSKSQEHTMNNVSRCYRKNGKEKVIKITKKFTEKRVNDYSGVVTAKEMENLNGK